jgi:hypothetical protein
MCKTKKEVYNQWRHQDGTELITLGSSINPNVHFIKTDAVLGSTAILVHGSSGQIQYAIQPDLLAGQNTEGQQIYFSGGSFPVDQVPMV